MIMATMPLRNSTIMTLLTMENQWIWSSVIFRYVSQRDAQRMSLGCGQRQRQREGHTQTQTHNGRCKQISRWLGGWVEGIHLT